MEPLNGGLNPSEIGFEKIEFDVSCFVCVSVEKMLPPVDGFVECGLKNIKIKTIYDTKFTAFTASKGFQEK